MIRYKVWVEIEEVDDERSVYEDASPFPVCLGEYESVEEADAVIEQITGKSSLNP